jgi:hypothetical protein
LVKGKWAAGISPRNFTWVIRDRLAISERPGGFGTNHRRVRRQEEIIWLRVQGFSRVISLLPSPHNLHAYEEGELSYAHYALTAPIDPGVLSDCFEDIDRSLAEGLRILMHRDELGDLVTGAAAGYLVWSERLVPGPRAVALLEHLVGHQMGSRGRELVAAVEALPPRQVV